GPATHPPPPERPPVAAVDRRLRQVQCSSTFLWTVPSSRSTTTGADIGGDALVGDLVHLLVQGVGAIHAPRPDVPRAHRRPGPEAARRTARPWPHCGACRGYSPPRASCSACSPADNRKGSACAPRCR